MAGTLIRSLIFCKRANTLSRSLLSLTHTHTHTPDKPALISSSCVDRFVEIVTKDTGVRQQKTRIPG